MTEKNYPMNTVPVTLELTLPEVRCLLASSQAQMQSEQNISDQLLGMPHEIKELLMNKVAELHGGEEEAEDAQGMPTTARALFYKALYAIQTFEDGACADGTLTEDERVSPPVGGENRVPDSFDLFMQMLAEASADAAAWDDAQWDGVRQMITEPETA